MLKPIFSKKKVTNFFFPNMLRVNILLPSSLSIVLKSVAIVGIVGRLEKLGGDGFVRLTADSTLRDRLRVLITLNGNGASFSAITKK